MAPLNFAEWQKLPISLSELCINTTLRCGQSFRWRKNDRGVWSIALHNRILSLHQDPEYLYYRTIPPSAASHNLQAGPLTPPPSEPPSLPEDGGGEGEKQEAGEEEAEEEKEEGEEKAKDDDTLALIKHYFNLEPNLTALYKEWSASDPNFAKRAPAFTGVRILRQDAWEALVGFICSSNNNIIRISQMVHKLCVHYGPLLGHLHDDDGGGGGGGGAEPYHDFPTPQHLAHEGVEQKLRNLGFGYRAKYIAQTARMVVAKEEGWLDSLRNPETPLLGTPASPAGDLAPEGRPGYVRAHEALLELQGVGPKVADCVCLMGLGWGEAVPVDTHVWQIAQRDYHFGRGKHASLTKATYDAVGAKFRCLWGKEAGWAHSVLFTADLKVFSARVKQEVQWKNTEIVEVKKEEEGIGHDDDKTEGVMVKREEVLENTVVKREYVDEGEERKVLQVEQKKSTRSKRQRRH